MSPLAELVSFATCFIVGVIAAPQGGFDSGLTATTEALTVCAAMSNYAPAPVSSVSVTTSFDTTLTFTAFATTTEVVTDDLSTWSPGASVTSPTSTGIDSSATSLSASSSATCEDPNDPCIGDITYYGGGANGACGSYVDPNGNGVALPFEFMGLESNDNPYCGRTLLIYDPVNGTTVQGAVVDKCMGCEGRSIDLTQALFDNLTDGGLPMGRFHDMEWWFQ